MTWDKYIAAFEYDLRNDKFGSPHTIEAYLRDTKLLGDYMRVANPKITPLDVERKHLESFIDYMVNNLQFKPRSINRTIWGIRAFFQNLYLQEKISSNPAEGIDSLRPPKTLPRVLLHEEVDRLFESIDLSTPEGTRDRAILEVLYSSGLRVTELLTLRINNIYFNQQLIKIEGKGLKIRVIPITEAALHYVKLYMEHVRKVHCKPTKAAKDLVFLNRYGAPLSRISVFKMIKKRTEKVGINPELISPHTFRHTCATHLVQNKASLTSVQYLLGHASLNTTEIYTHIDIEFVKEAMKEFNPRKSK